jgi:hypothetical protein
MRPSKSSLSRIKDGQSWEWWDAPIIPALRWLRQKDHKFKAKKQNDNKKSLKKIKMSRNSVSVSLSPHIYREVEFISPLLTGPGTASASQEPGPSIGQQYLT